MEAEQAQGIALRAQVPTKDLPRALAKISEVLYEREQDDYYVRVSASMADKKGNSVNRYYLWVREGNEKAIRQALFIKRGWVFIIGEETDVTRAEAQAIQLLHLAKRRGS